MNVSEFLVLASFLRRLEQKAGTYSRVIGASDLLNQAHQQHIWLFRCPVVRQMFLCLRSHTVVGRLQGLQQLCQLGMNLCWEHRHLCDWCCGRQESLSLGYRGQIWRDRRLCILVTLSREQLAQNAFVILCDACSCWAVFGPVVGVVGRQETMSAEWTGRKE